MSTPSLTPRYLAQAIRAVMATLHLTQHALARRARLTQGTLAHLIHDLRRPEERTIRRLTHAYGPPHDLDLLIAHIHDEIVRAHHSPGELTPITQPDTPASRPEIQRLLLILEDALTHEYHTWHPLLADLANMYQHGGRVADQPLALAADPPPDDGYQTAPSAWPWTDAARVGTSTTEDHNAAWWIWLRHGRRTAAIEWHAYADEPTARRVATQWALHGKRSLTVGSGIPADAVVAKHQYVDHR